VASAWRSPSSVRLERSSRPWMRCSRLKLLSPWRTSRIRRDTGAPHTILHRMGGAWDALHHQHRRVTGTAGRL